MEGAAHTPKGRMKMEANVDAEMAEPAGVEEEAATDGREEAAGVLEETAPTIAASCELAGEPHAREPLWERNGDRLGERSG